MLEVMDSNYELHTDTIKYTYMILCAALIYRGGLNRLIYSVAKNANPKHLRYHSY